MRNDVLTAETEDIAAVRRYPKRNPTADAFENRQVGRCRLRIRIPPVNYCNTLRELSCEEVEECLEHSIVWFAPMPEVVLPLAQTGIADNAEMSSDACVALVDQF